MHHEFLLFILSLGLAPSAWATQPEKTWTLGGNSDIGMMFKGRPDADRTNMIGAVGLYVLADVDVSENWRLGFGLGAPTIEAATVAVPLSARYHPWGWQQSGWYWQAQLTPMIALGTPCAWDDSCELPFPNIDQGRLYRAAGAAAKLGGGVQINWQPVWLFMDASINAGLFKGLKTDDGFALDDGLYLGGEMTIGLKFPL